MGGQVALALVLVVSSGLMLRSFQKLRNVDPGFNPASALTFRVGLPDRQYSSRRAAVAAHQAILDSLSTIPGVTAVSASTCLPLTRVVRSHLRRRLTAPSATDGGLLRQLGDHGVAPERR